MIVLTTGVNRAIHCTGRAKGGQARGVRHRLTCNMPASVGHRRHTCFRWWARNTGRAETCRRRHIARPSAAARLPPRRAAAVRSAHDHREPPPPGTQGPTSRGFASERLSVTQSCINESVLDTLALQPPKSMLTAGPAAPRHCGQTLDAAGALGRGGGRCCPAAGTTPPASQPPLLLAPAPLHPGGLCSGAHLQGRGSSREGRLADIQSH